MANNLRAIYKNLADLSTTTITASSTASASTLTTNLKLDAKSLIWRSAVASTNAIKANLVINLTTQQYSIGGLILGFNNLSSEATMRVTGYIGNIPTLTGTVDLPTYTNSGSLMFDTGFVVCTEAQNLGDLFWGVSSLGLTAYQNKKGYGRVWIDPTSQVPITSLLVEIVDPNNFDKYVEISRLVLGSYWSPQYNTAFGLSASTVDMSTSERTESGDLITTNGSSYNKMTFDLKYMSKKDRSEFNNLVKTVGMKKPVFISLFPNNYEDTGKEQLYQMYGKLSQLYGIEHPIFETYSSQVELEEI